MNAPQPREDTPYKQRLILVDGSGYIFRAFHGLPPLTRRDGTHDEVVPFVAMEAAATTLRNENVNVEAHARPRLGHGIDEEGIDITAAFLRRVFAI